MVDPNNRFIFPLADGDVSFQHESMISNMTVDDEIALEVENAYEFFTVDHPENIGDGLLKMNYNIIKGSLSGVGLMATAPFLDAAKCYSEKDEDGNIAGVLGGIKGFGTGIYRGLIGGVCLTGAGLGYGLKQFAEGLSPQKNAETIANGVNTICTDISHLAMSPVGKLVLQKGYGLEEFIASDEKYIKAREEEERIANQEEDQEDNFDEENNEFNINNEQKIPHRRVIRINTGNSDFHNIRTKDHDDFDHSRLHPAYRKSVSTLNDDSEGSDLEDSILYPNTHVKKDVHDV
jgi:hypothetical protein